MSIDKVKKLHEKLDVLSEFEKSFVSGNFARIEKFDGDVNFSEKQTSLIDRIYQERVVEGKPARKAGG